MEIVGELAAQEVVVQPLFIRDVPGITAMSQQRRFVGVNRHQRDAKFVSDLLRSQPSGKRLEHFELSRSGQIGNSFAIGVFLALHLCALLILHDTKGLSGVVDVGAQRDELTLDQSDAALRRDVHAGTIFDLFGDMCGRIDMPDMVIAVKIE